MNGVIDGTCVGSSTIFVKSYQIINLAGHLCIACDNFLSRRRSSSLCHDSLERKENYVLFLWRSDFFI